jgi:GR25 family glycosyltransferase involved in LPS biosynthesis
MVTLNIFIIHYKKLVGRVKNIDQLKKLAEEVNDITINIHTITDHQPEDINVNNIKNLVKLEQLPEGENTFYQKFVKQMSLPVFSNTFQHFKAIQQISKTSPTDFNMVLEDDVVYSQKIFTQLATLIENLKSVEWDILFLGQPSEKAPITNNLQLTDIDTTDLLLHCCESYMLTSKVAKDMLINFFPIRFVYNIQLSFLIDKHKYKVLKIFPNICGDGSKMGDYTSSILLNNVLIFNDLYKKIYIQLESPTPLTKDELKEVETLFYENPRKQNPDFIYLEALFNKKIGNIEKSKLLFESAMVFYEEGCVPMNNTSTFLKNYMELFRVLQN